MGYVKGIDEVEAGDTVVLRYTGGREAREMLAQVTYSTRTTITVNGSTPTSGMKFRRADGTHVTGARGGSRYSYAVRAPCEGEVEQLRAKEIAQRVEADVKRAATREAKRGRTSGIITCVIDALQAELERVNKQSGGGGALLAALLTRAHSLDYDFARAEDAFREMVADLRRHADHAEGALANDTSCWSPSSSVSDAKTIDERRMATAAEIRQLSRLVAVAIGVDEADMLAPLSAKV